MSWDGYVDSICGAAGGDCDLSCIIGLDGSVWTTIGNARHLKISPQEAAAIGKSMNSSDYSKFQASGIFIVGVKYQFLRADDTVLLGKKKDNGSVTLQKTKTAVVIGHTKEGGTQGNTNKNVGAIAEYLESLGM